MSTQKRNTKGLTPFPKGQSGNPGGKTKAHRQAEVRAAEKAAQLREAMIDALISAVQAEERNLLDHIDPATLKLFKDSEDRAFGSPAQSVEHTSPDGTMTPAPALDVSKLSTAALAEIMAISDAVKRK